MTSIVVTYPRNTPEEIEPPTIEGFRENSENYHFHYWKIPNRPKDANKGDKCYIGFGGHIQGYFLIDEIKYVSSEDAEEIDNYIGGAGIMIKSHHEFHELSNPKPTYKRGTRGFWYFDEACKNGLINGYNPRNRRSVDEEYDEEGEDDDEENER